MFPIPPSTGVPAVCLLMLKMTFNQGEVKDEGRGLWLDLTHPSSVEAVKDESAIGGWAGAFRGTGLSVPYFKQVRCHVSQTLIPSENRYDCFFSLLHAHTRTLAFPIHSYTRTSLIHTFLHTDIHTFTYTHIFPHRLWRERKMSCWLACPNLYP